jgi:hypothetical protein
MFGSSFSANKNTGQKGGCLVCVGEDVGVGVVPTVVVCVGV